MASTDFGELRASRARHRAEEREARLLFCLIYPLCLGSALGARMVRLLRGAGGPHERASVFREAQTLAASCVGFAFR